MNVPGHLPAEFYTFSAGSTNLIKRPARSEIIYIGIGLKFVWTSENVFYTLAVGDDDRVELGIGRYLIFTVAASSEYRSAIAHIKHTCYSIIRQCEREYIMLTIVSAGKN